MSIFTRAWYRLYQAAMYLGSYAFDFSPPELLSGSGSIKRLPAFITSKGYNRVLVVTDQGLAKLGLPGALLAALAEEGLSYALYDGTQPNPTIPNIEEALDLYRRESCQAIVAFGGGSPMDCAKGVAVRAANPRKRIQDLRGTLKVGRRPVPVFAVPTTAGTGSETTVAAVITDPATHEKYAVNDPKLIPPYAVLDPELTLGLPPGITGTTGMDALTHAVEAYIGRSNTRITRAAAEEAVSLIFGYLERAYKNGSDLEARERMLMAAHKAGIAFTRAYVGYVHAIAHQLGGLYGMAHGLANAIILPHVLRAYGPAVDRPLARLARLVRLATDAEGDHASATRFIEAIEAMNKRMGIPAGIPDIKDADVDLIVSRAFREAHPLYPVPRFFSRDECAALVRALKAAGN